jgi:protein-disulfide isomerase
VTRFVFRGQVLSFSVLMLLVTHLASAQETRPVASTTLEALLAAPLITPASGAQRGDVTLVEYFDYNCPVCRALEPQLQKLLASDRGVRLVRKDWPIFGEGSVYAAYCAFAASQEGRYQAAHDALMTSSKDLDSKEDVLSVLRAAGFDVAKIESDVARHRKEYDDALARIRREAQELGLRGTPGVIVGNQLVLGRADSQRLQQLIARARLHS